MTVSEVYEALRVRYSPPAWAFFPEIPDQTGWASRTADAVAFGLWPSQGLELHGFEIKASRSDWSRELKRPQKADKVLGYCDRIWVVSTVKGLVPIETLPPKWGLLEPYGGGLRATKQAEINPEARPLTKSFFASLMRQAHRYMEHAIETSDGTQKAYEKGRDEEKRASKFTIESLTSKNQELTKAILEFQEASGVQIHTWNGKRIGEAVELVMRDGVAGIESRIRQIRDGLNRTLTDLEGKGGVEDERERADEGNAAVSVSQGGSRPENQGG